VQQVGSLVYGPPSIIPQRVQMELAFLNATLIDLNPAGITNRWISYTAHPSQTPGVHQTSIAFAACRWLCAGPGAASGLHTGRLLFSCTDASTFLVGETTHRAGSKALT